MNDDIYTRDTGRSRNRVEPENTTKKRTHAEKLKNETSQAKAMRGKLRTGKADTSETKLDIKQTAKLHKQGRKAARKNVAVSGEIRHQMNEAKQAEARLQEAENSQILSDVGALNLSPEQLAEFLKLATSGKLATAGTSIGNTDRSTTDEAETDDYNETEDFDDEEN